MKKLILPSLIVAAAFSLGVATKIHQSNAKADTTSEQTITTKDPSPMTAQPTNHTPVTPQADPTTTVPSTDPAPVAPDTTTATPPAQAPAPADPPAKTFNPVTDTNPDVPMGEQPNGTINSN